MIWLGQVLRCIQDTPVLSDEYKTKLMIVATDLSAVCDRWAPLAPEPEVSFLAHGEVAREGLVDGSFRVGWWDFPNCRMLSLWIDCDTGLLLLKMWHGEYKHEIESPNLSVITSAVRSFFDKWGSP